jgi:hypothetical protein
MGSRTASTPAGLPTRDQDLRTAASRGPLILTFSDWNYRPILENWLLHLSALGLTGMRVYCLDEQTRDWCVEHAVDAELVPWDGNLGRLWQQRLAVFSELLANGIEFIHSDLDAVWLQNPLAPDSSARQPEDLVFSQGTIWPPDIHQVWGFVLCCGWFWVKPTPAVQEFFRALARDVATTGDDQVSVNRLLRATGMTWQTGGGCDYNLRFRKDLVHCWTRPLRGRSADGSLSAVMLPHRQFQRLFEPTSHVVVRHFLTPKQCDQKMVVLREFGLAKVA